METNKANLKKITVAMEMLINNCIRSFPQVDQFI